MASFDTTRPAAGFSAGRIFSFVGGLFAAFADWRDQRATRNALRSLSARELDDIGLSFGDIESVVVRKL